MTGRLVAGLVAVSWASAADAHPMGTLSENRSAILRVARDETELAYTVDFAEVPSAAEAGRFDALGADAYATTRMGELLPGLSLTVDGEARPLTVEGCAAYRKEGEGGLPVVTLMCMLDAAPIASGRVALDDANFAGAPGWRELKLVGDGVDVGEPSDARVMASADYKPFAENGAGPSLSHVEATVGVPGAVAPVAVGPGRERDPLAELVGGDDLSWRFQLGALVSAMVLGAGHALSPGHGKTMVAAYLVGARGTVGQALLLGVVVTLTHVSSVLALGVVTLGLSRYVVAASLYPWIGMASGLGVVGVGAALLMARVGRGRGRGRGRGMDGEHGEHEHVVVDAKGEPVSTWRLLVLGVTGGAVPCPSALVVLLAAVALHRIVFGMALIVAFSVGLAAVLMAIGVLVVRARGLLARFEGASAAARWVPVGSAVVVVMLGVGLVVESAREGGWL